MAASFTLRILPNATAMPAAHHVSALGEKQTFAAQNGMSAKCQ